MQIFATETVYDCILKTVNLVDFNSQNTVIFAEDKITLSVELELARKNGGGFSNVDVLTFKRYASRFNDSKKVLSKESSVMIVRKIIMENANGLTCFKKAVRPSLAETVYELISQLKSAKVSPIDLKDLIKKENAGVTGALFEKIKDIEFIYEKYDEYLLNNSVYDSNDYLSLAPEIILNDEYIKNSNVILCGFSSVTTQRAEVFKALKESAKSVTAVVIYSKNSELYTGETLEKVCKIFDTENIIYERGNLNKTAERIKKYLFNPEVFKKDFVGENSNQVEILESHSLTEEVELIAREILKEVKKGKRFKDIAVAVGSLQNYDHLITRFFSEYKIPFFIDKNTSLESHPVYSYIISYLELIRRGFSVKDFISFTTNGLFYSDKFLTDKLSNYVLKYSLSRKELKNEFTFESEDLKDFEALRFLCYDVYKQGEKAKTAKDYVNAVKYMLEKTKAFENAELSGKKLEEYNELGYADFNEKVPEKVFQILDETEKILGETPLNLNDFESILSSGASSMTIGKIPLYYDAVYVGEIKDVRIKSPKILFAIGLNGEVPFTKSDTAILSDGDLTELDGFKIIVEPKIRAVNEREKENVGLTLISFTEKLNCSFSNTGFSGEPITKSPVINYITKIFNIVPIRKNINCDNAYRNLEIADGFSSQGSSVRRLANLYSKLDLHDGFSKMVISSFNDAVKRTDYNALKEKADGVFLTSQEKVLQNAKDYCFTDGFASATTIEKYFSCPYANYAQNILGLTEKETGAIGVNRIGTAIHEHLEKFVKRINEITDSESLCRISDEILTEILNGKEYSYYKNQPKYEYLFGKLLEETRKTSKSVYHTIKNSLFTPTYFEVPFGDGEKFKAINLHTSNGNYKIRGKVDRIDVFGNYIRVIDYKTGKVDRNEKYLYFGTKLQLYLYMNAFLTDEIKPAGLYYEPIKDEFVDEESTPNLLEGITVNTDENINATDIGSIERKSSDIVKLKFTTTGKIHKTNSHVVTEEEMQNRLNYAVKVAKNGVNEILSGYIKPSPLSTSPCEYCSYGGMCFKNVKDDNSVRKESAKKISKVTGINVKEDL